MANANATMQGIGKGASLLGGTIQRGMEMAELPENGIAERIQDLNAMRYNAGSFDDLSSLVDATQWAKTNYRPSDLLGMSRGEAFGKLGLNVLQGAMEGADFGTSISPGIGTAIGFGVGAGAELIGSGAGLGARMGNAEATAGQANYEGKRVNKEKMDEIRQTAMDLSQNKTNEGYISLSAFGGPLYIDDTFTNGIRKIENGGTHEQNPLSGVPMGIATDGLQNLVEEGELIYNDYVYSKRLMVPEANKALLGLKKNKDYTFADAADELQKESEERPNDILSKRSLDIMMGRLQDAQETVKQKKESRRLRAAYNKLSPTEKMSLAFAMQQPQEIQPGYAAEGGQLAHMHAPYFNSSDPYSSYLNSYKSGGIPNTVQSFIKGMNEERSNNFRKAAHETGAPVVDKTPTTLKKPAISYKGYVEGKAKQAGKNAVNASPTKAGTQTEESTGNNNIGSPFAQTLRNSSVFGALSGAIGSLFDKPNYSNMERAEKAMAAVPRVSAGHIGQKMRYNPLDINYLAAQTMNQGLGARRAMQEAGMGAQPIIVGNYATQTGLGQNLLSALAQNEARKAQALEFNRGTDTTNVSNDLQAALANQRRDIMGANFLLETGQLRDKERAITQNNRSVQWTNAYNQMHNLGTDMLNREMVAANVDSGTYGVMNEIMKRLANGTLKLTSTSANGGKLNTKKGGKHA